MPLERKRKGSENESAIAKLRKARSVTSKTPTREASLEVPPSAPLKSKKEDERPRSVVRKSQRLTAPPQPAAAEDGSSDAPDEGNSFAALNALDVLQGQRIYERLSNGRLRVQLSRNADCVIAGRCAVWVKQGTVFVLGAAIKASTNLHHISAPTSLALPSIRALGGDAEIELGDIQVFHKSTTRSLPNPFRAPPGTNVAALERNYYVLGLDFVPPADQIPRLLFLDDAYFKDIPYLNPNSSSAPCIYFSGNRPLETATLVRCVLNRLVTIHKHSDEEGILFVDVASDSPVLSPPGFLTVFQLTGPVLGPSFDRSSQKRVSVVEQYFVGPMTAELPPNAWHRRCLADLLASLSTRRTQQKQQPIVVNLGRASSLERRSIDRMWADLTPTAVLALESSIGNSNLARLSEHADRRGTPVRLLPPINEIAHLSRSHTLNMQSYFSTLQDEKGAFVLQSPDYVFGSQELSFRYSGPGAEVFAITTVDVHLPKASGHNSIAGLIAAVALVDLGVANMLSSHMYRCGTSRLQAIPPLTSLELNASLITCLGLCYITEVDVVEGKLHIRTPIHRQRIEDGMMGGKVLLLIIQPPTREGTFMCLPP